jgi:thioredoxin-dependent peroxiredoxin
MFEWLFSSPLPPGTPAPDFTLPDQDGTQVSLASLRGKNVVLVFYPGDDTPGCTKQLCEFRDHWGSAKNKNTLVFGVNPQGAKSHTKFIGKYKLPFPLLVDQGQTMGEAYQTKGLIVKRTVYLIGPDGVIRFSKRGMPNPDEVLGYAK